MPTLLDAIPNLHIRFVLHGSGEVVMLAREFALCSLVVQELLTDVELLAAEDEVLLTIPACPQVPVGGVELALANRVVRAFCALFPAEVAAEWENAECWADKMVSAASLWPVLGLGKAGIEEPKRSLIESADQQAVCKLKAGQDGQ